MFEWLRSIFRSSESTESESITRRFAEGDTYYEPDVATTAQDITYVVYEELRESGPQTIESVSESIDEPLYIVDEAVEQLCQRGTLREVIHEGSRKYKAVGTGRFDE